MKHTEPSTGQSKLWSRAISTNSVQNEASFLEERVDNERNGNKQRVSLNDLIHELRNRSSNEISFENVKWSSSDAQLQPIPIFVKTFGGSLLQLQVYQTALEIFT